MTLSCTSTISKTQLCGEGQRTLSLGTGVDSGWLLG